jgi:hypothetical protein
MLQFLDNQGAFAVRATVSAITVAWHRNTSIDISRSCPIKRTIRRPDAAHKLSRVADGHEQPLQGLGQKPETAAPISVGRRNLIIATTAAGAS